jgi:hypothetical protein
MVEVIMSGAARQAAQLSDLVPICSRLPSASVDQLIGATRVISHGGGRMGHAQLVAALHLDDEQTVGVVEFLSCLGLGEVIGSDVALSEVGNRIASSGIPGRRRLFAELAIRLPSFAKSWKLSLANPLAHFLAASCWRLPERNCAPRTRTESSIM